MISTANLEIACYSCSSSEGSAHAVFAIIIDWRWVGTKLVGVELKGGEVWSDGQWRNSACQKDCTYAPSTYQTARVCTRRESACGRGRFLQQSIVVCE
jgi:hypothetical protein